MLTTIYKISVTVEKPTGNLAKMRGKEDVMVVAQFTDPGSVPAGLEENNYAVAIRQEMNKN
jgi:hypothetical protein